MIAGNTNSPDEMVDRDLLDEMTATFTSTVGALYLSKITVPADGFGSTSGDQTFTAQVLDSDDEVLGEQVGTFADLNEFEWWDIVFDRPVLLDTEDATYTLKLIAGESALSTRTGEDADGADCLFATLTRPWEPPYVEDDYLASLGYASAQKALSGIDPAQVRRLWGDSSETPAQVKGDPRTRRRVLAAWHGTFLDSKPPGGSYAIVQRDGALSDLVGDRVVVQAGTKQTVVYIHRETDLDLPDDTQISLSRRAWLALAPLGDDTLSVTVTVLGDT